MSKLGTITNQIIEMAGRQGGIASTDIPGLKSEDLSARCCALVRRGILFRGGSGRGKIRYFATAEAAKAHDTEHTQAPDVTISQRSAHANFSKTAKEVITSKTKVTICPPWQPRFQVVPVPFIHSGNQRGRA
jgi:hypothetical protein